MADMSWLKKEGSEVYLHFLNIGTLYFPRGGQQARRELQHRPLSQELLEKQTSFDELQVECG